MQIDQAQGITLRAFFAAIALQTAPLPEDIKAEMNAIGQIFTTDIKSAINQLADLAQHPRLEPIYKNTRQELQKYQPEEMNRFSKTKTNPEQELTNLPLAVVNNLISTLQSSDPQQAADAAQGLSGSLKSLGN